MAAMAAGDEHASSEILRGLARHLNCLNEDNKSTRKRALELIKRETVDKGLSSCVLQELFSALLKPLLKCLSDPMERCRETALTMTTEFIRCVPKPEESLPYLMPCLAQRLGEKETLEPAEELRLLAVEMLTLTVEVRESCKCTINVAKSLPEHFHMQAESLMKPLMQTIAHQHSRVRVSVVEATGAVIQHSNGKNVDDVLSHLAQRLFDDSPQVRRAVTVVVGDWLLQMKDRYSYFHKLVPLLLTCISDEIPEISCLAADLWKQVGAQWEKENEDDIKDKLDFLLTQPPFYPQGVERPGLGCRELVVRHLGRLVPAISNDITDWLVPTRVRTSQLLSLLLLHAEDHSIQHLQPLLAILYRASTDAERDVVSNSLAAAKLLGTFVPPAVFLKLLLDHVTNLSSSSHPWAPLMVLAAVLGGCSKPLLKPHLQEIANKLAQPDVCQEYQQVSREKLGCVLGAVVGLCGCTAVSERVRLQRSEPAAAAGAGHCQSLCPEPHLSEKALESVQCLCKVQGLDSVKNLYRQHMRQLLDWLSASVNTWSSYSPQRLQLHIIVIQSGPVIGEFVSQLMPLLCCCLQPDRDIEMRMTIFTMLAKLLLDATNTLDSQGHFRDESEKFLWAITPGQLLCLEEKVSPQVLSALEEDSQMARLLACRSLSTILRLIGASLHPEALNKIYPVLLKRLDDSSEEVRSVALQALGLWLSSLTKDYPPELYAAHLQLLFQQLLLYLDDPDDSVQGQVLEILKKGSSVHPSLLQREAEAVRDKQRSPLYCDQLLQHISSLPAGAGAD
ncbi:Dynein assembly factor 5 axonemal [Dissostichus eleginoides]|uniref:Dynein assembly factor 5 axonemal n=1 Tax=Dissostichus eleginoides TaxID=100907 RepID=A0AAD9B4P6_DISEL|nr:Dynein assembly factor 5 axonemal [Dissostichus eleginoides]